MGKSLQDGSEFSDEFRVSKSDPTYAVGFSLWKRPHVRAFLQDREVVFTASPAGLPKSGLLEVVSWGMRYADSDFPTGSRVLRLEDGFIRSVGLGAELVRPLSWVCDDLGIYYNPQKSSRLEALLREGAFTSALLSRAVGLREQLTISRVTKYNVGKTAWARPQTGKRVILVPGQVESDASIRFGAADIKTNMGLLKEVRRRNSEAFVIYKPHPDVVAGLRAQGADECDANLYCDSVIEDVAMSDLLDGVDEIHTMTSLTGFEALLRGKRVVTYGMPFYAGWGLTDDLGMSKSVAARRDRTLNLDELVAGALILYPTYVSRHTGLLTTPETVLQELKEWRSKGAKQPRWAMSMLRWGLSFMKY